MSASFPYDSPPPLQSADPARAQRHEPVDFGTHRTAVLRSLELNSRLLHEPALDVDETAMRAKIDELLDRLINLNDDAKG